MYRNPVDFRAMGKSKSKKNRSSPTKAHKNGKFPIIIAGYWTKYCLIFDDDKYVSFNRLYFRSTKKIVVPSIFGIHFS
uniref:Uncharacterized protein n=1 Tax=Romanomermis culicivorax TaxID=13658 RepID=A0A915L092_ROMCU